jgi:hypothetical protein
MIQSTDQDDCSMVRLGFQVESKLDKIDQPDPACQLLTHIEEAHELALKTVLSDLMKGMLS